MKFAVYGAGAVGGYFGGRLAESGQDVTFIARGAQLEALSTRGLSIESPEGDAHLDEIEVRDNPGNVGPVDVVFVAVKAWQLGEVAERMRPLIGPDTAVVPLQNGVEAPEVLASVLGRRHVMGGLCRIVSALVSPGQVRHGGSDPTITFGELDNAPSARSDALLRALNEARGMSGVRAEDIQVAMWQKFMLICPWSGLGAITRAPAGIFRSVPQTRQMLVGILEEVAAVGRASGVALAADAVQTMLEVFDSVPAGATASMQRDIMDGFPSELHVQNGAVVRLGRDLGIETPVNEFIFNALLPMERKARGELDW